MKNMNFKFEEYKNNPTDLLKISYQISDNIQRKLVDKNCPQLKNLYYTKRDANHTNKDEFRRIGDNTENIGSLMGIYVFGEEINKKIKPIYVGISRNIHRRLSNHGWGNSHSLATLAYLIAETNYPKNEFSIKNSIFKARVVSKCKREDIDKYYDVEKAKEEVRNFRVAIYPIEDNYAMYFHEVAISGIFKTFWNSFKTH